MFCDGKAEFSAVFVLSQSFLYAYIVLKIHFLLISMLYMVVLLNIS